MIKKCYRLLADKAIAEELGVKVLDAVYDIDEDYTSKREYIKAAKAYTAKVNEEFGLNCTWQELFGEPEAWWRYCTICGESFPADEDHDCE